MNKKIQQLSKDIKSIKIQGATNVFYATLDILELLLIEYKNLELNKFKQTFEKEADKISLIRATEPMSRNAVKYILHKLEKNKLASTIDAISNIKQSIEYLKSQIKQIEKNIVKNGTKIINKNDRVMTHCHSSLVEKILISQKNKNILVYNTETRPLMQGRITSRKLVANGIKTTMIVDSAASFFISPYSGDLKMDKVIVGCDAISIDGSIVNKVGSYGIALACKESNIPIYVSGSLLKYDSQDDVNIEIRHNNEIWKNPNSNKINMINIAFDYVPEKLIAGIICEFGIIKTNQVNNLIQKHYPWILEKKVKLIS